MNDVISTKKVLIVKLSPYNALTSSNMRTMALIKGLQDLGYTVDWLTISSSAVHTLRNLNSYRFMDSVNYIFANNNTVYDKLVTPKSKLKTKIVGVLRKIYHIFQLYDYTESISNKINISLLPQKDYKYVFSISDPKTSHIVVRKLRGQGLTFEKWIQYWGDPLVGDITKNNIYPHSIMIREEKKLFDSCDKIVYTSPFTLEDSVKYHNNYRNKMLVVPTPFMEKKQYGETTNAKPLVGYFGAYKSNVRNLLPLYQAATQLDGFFDFIFVGDTDLQLDTTKNINIKPRGDISEYEKQTDIYVCVLNLSGTQIPGKVYHDAATDKPVLIILDGENSERIKAYLSTFNRYYFCNNNSNDISASLRLIVRENIKWQPSCELEPEIVVKKMIFD